MANVANFADLFGGKPREIPINYDSIAHDITLPTLPLLALTDDIETTADKMKTFAAVIESGSSIAIRTGTYRCSPGDAAVDRTALELAEVRLVHEMAAISDANKARTMAEMRALTKRIHVAMEVIRTRKDDLGAKIPGSKAHRKRARLLELQARRARQA
ncbi:hypothetical protein MN608_06615 [Microdochium nivale]|nr:hypothetical protein MN608_06615 [Microdochium nivale]